MVKWFSNSDVVRHDSPQGDGKEDWRVAAGRAAAERSRAPHLRNLYALVASIPAVFWLLHLVISSVSADLAPFVLEYSALAADVTKWGAVAIFAFMLFEMSRFPKPEQIGWIAAMLFAPIIAMILCWFVYFVMKTTVTDLVKERSGDRPDHL